MGLSATLGSSIPHGAMQNLVDVRNITELATLTSFIMPKESEAQHVERLEALSQTPELDLRLFAETFLYLFTNGLLGNTPAGRSRHSREWQGDTLGSGPVPDEISRLLIRLLRLANLDNTHAMNSLVSLESLTGDVLVAAIYRTSIQVGDLRLLKIMLDVGMDPNDGLASVYSTPDMPLRPLELAVTSCSSAIGIRVIELLISYGASVQPTNGSRSFLRRARRQSLEVYDVLISHGAKPSRHDFVEAVQDSDIAFFEVSLEGGMDLNLNCQIHEDMLNPANIEKDGKTILGFAHSPDIIRWLVEHGADVDALQYLMDRNGTTYSTTPLGIAAIRGDVDAIHALLDAGAKVDLPMSSPNFAPPIVLAVDHRSILGDNLEAAMLLLHRGADIQAADRCELIFESGERSMSRRPIYCLGDDRSLARVLAQAGVNSYSNPERSRLLCRLFPCLRQYGLWAAWPIALAGIPASYTRQEVYLTAIERAIERGDIETLKLIREQVASPSRQLVAFIGSIETAEYLHSIGWLFGILCTNGSSILAWAIFHQLEGLSSFLITHNADHLGIMVDHSIRNTGIPRADPLEAAIFTESLTLAQNLVHRGAALTEKHINLIVWRACESRHPHLLLPLLDEVPQGMCIPTAFGFATHFDSSFMVDHLLYLGFSPLGYPSLPHEKRFKALNLYFENYRRKSSWPTDQGFHEEDLTSCSFSVLYMAICYGNRGILQSLLALNLWTQDEKGFLLEKKIQSGMVIGFEELLASGVDLNSTAINPLSLSLKFRNISFARGLIDAGCHIHRKFSMGKPALHFLLSWIISDKLTLPSQTNPELLELLYLFINPSNFKEIRPFYDGENGDIILLQAIWTALPNLVGPLLQAKVGYAYRPELGRNSLPTASLQVAIQKDQQNVIRMLLDNEAHVNSPPVKVSWESTHRANLSGELKIDGTTGFTSLQLAVRQNNFELVESLLERGADVNQRAADRGGATALQLASLRGYIGLARRLLDAGAVVDAPRARLFGRTAIEAAAEWHHIDVLQLLLGKGGPPTDLNRTQYVRAVVLADRRGHFPIAKFLKRWITWTKQDAQCYAEQLFDEDEEEAMKMADVS